MQKKTRTLLLAGLGLAVVATATIAGSSPKFLRAPSATLEFPSGKSAASSLTFITPIVAIDWTEVGLGKTGTIDYEARASAAARYQCVNIGGNCPAASNKADVFSEIAVNVTLGIDNGRITGELALPAPESTLVCPGNQVVSLVSVAFTNITLTDITNGVTSKTNPSALAYRTSECP